MYDMSDHIQSKLIHLRWQIGTYQSHIKYIQGQIRLIHRLFHLIILLNFCFQKCRDPNPRLDPMLADPSRSPIYSDIFNYLLKTCYLVLLNFSFSKVSRLESPTRPGWRIQAGAQFTPTFSIIFSKHVVWFY